MPPHAIFYVQTSSIMYSMFAYLYILSRYSLKPPSNSTIECYIEKIVNALLKDEIDKKEIMEKFILKFENISKDMDNDEKWKAACRIVGKKMVRDNLALRKKSVGEFLHAIRIISQQSFSEDTFRLMLLLHTYCTLVAYLDS